MLVRSGEKRPCRITLLILSCIILEWLLCSGFYPSQEMDREIFTRCPDALWILYHPLCPTLIRGKTPMSRSANRGVCGLWHDTNLVHIEGTQTTEYLVAVGTGTSWHDAFSLSFPFLSFPSLWKGISCSSLSLSLCLSVSPTCYSSHPCGGTRNILWPCFFRCHAHRHQERIAGIW